jgi:homoserine kinase type II
MAVYTRISREQLSAFLAGYRCGELQSFEGIQGGVENSNYHVHTSEGHYILTIFEKRVKEHDLPFFFAFTAHIAKHGIACPEAMEDRDGNTVGRIAGKPAALITFLQGEQITAAQITDSHCRELGQAVGRLHMASHDFRGYRANALSLGGWKELAEKTKDRADEVEKGLAAFIQKELAYLERMWPEHLPAAVIHADLFPDNVFFKDGKWSAFIDFYFSCNDFLAYDLALVINAWCFDANGKWNARKFFSLKKGYEAGRGLTDNEGHSLSVLCRGAAMRIMLTRLHDWLFHDPANFVVPKDPKEYLNKLRFHQHERITG